MISERTAKALNILRQYSDVCKDGCSPLLFAEKMWDDIECRYKEKKFKLMAGSYVGRLCSMGLARRYYTKSYSTFYYITEQGISELNKFHNPCNQQ